VKFEPGTTWQAVCNVKNPSVKFDESSATLSVTACGSLNTLVVGVNKVEKIYGPEGMMRNLMPYVHGDTDNRSRAFLPGH